MNEKVTPGIHPLARTDIEKYFSEAEKKIADYWSREWYITKSGHREMGNSAYNYMLIKATSSYEEMLGLAREIILILSAYDNFEPRSLDVYDAVYKLFQELRCERICYVLVSADANIEDALRTCLSNQESQIVVPFSYASFKKATSDQHFLRNQFRRYFYSRDLFDFSDPLKKDYYFFGRNDIVIDIIEKHKSNQNSGLFGLRKTGKTSIIYDILRKAPQRDIIGVFIDCQDTSFNMRRWNTALYYVIQRIVEETKLSLVINEQDFSETNAGMCFKQSLLRINNLVNSKTILLLFDEIENITFDKSGVDHWCNQLDFVYFWQTVRSAFQTTDRLFSFCILGTNPRCVETSLIKGKDNPIFNVFQPKYIPGFDQSQTREMVRKLGRLMGVTFEEGVYTRLTEEYGGHPFLIRRVCSAISQEFPNRPVTIDRMKYFTVRDIFNQETEYFKMLLEVLTQFYPDEYEMLQMLAFEDHDSFNFFALNDVTLTKHLVGYGIIKKSDNNYDFKIDSLRDYLIKNSDRKVLTKTPEEKWSYICIERNRLETDLRTLVRSVLRTAYITESDAKNHVIKKIYNNKANKYSAYSYADLFDSQKSEIYLKSLINLINADWNYFCDYFGNQEMFIQALTILNHEGRFDAHASIPDDDEMKMLEGAISKIRKGIEKFKS